MSRATDRRRQHPNAQLPASASLHVPAYIPHKTPWTTVSGRTCGPDPRQAGHQIDNVRVLLMTLYAALLYYPPDADRWQHPDECWAEHERFTDPAAQAGVLLGGQALCPDSTATTITVSQDGGDVLVTDGPFAEAKEILGGFYLIEAADRDEAIRWAARIPAAWQGKVELRPVQQPPA